MVQWKERVDKVRRGRHENDTRSVMSARTASADLNDTYPNNACNNQITLYTHTHTHTHRGGGASFYFLRGFASKCFTQKRFF